MSSRRLTTSRFQDPELYAALSPPRIALLTVGQENTFGHPTEQTLSLLSDVAPGSCAPTSTAP